MHFLDPCADLIEGGKTSSQVQLFKADLVKLGKQAHYLGIVFGKVSFVAMASFLIGYHSWETITVLKDNYYKNDALAGMYQSLWSLTCLGLYAFDSVHFAALLAKTPVLLYVYSSYLKYR